METTRKEAITAYRLELPAGRRHLAMIPAIGRWRIIAMFITIPATPMVARALRVGSTGYMRRAPETSSPAIREGHSFGRWRTELDKSWGSSEVAFSFHLRLTGSI